MPLCFYCLHCSSSYHSLFMLHYSMISLTIWSLRYKVLEDKEVSYGWFFNPCTLHKSPVISLTKHSGVSVHRICNCILSWRKLSARVRLQSGENCRSRLTSWERRSVTLTLRSVEQRSRWPHKVSQSNAQSEKRLGVIFVLIAVFKSGLLCLCLDCFLSYVFFFILLYRAVYQ